MLLHEHIEDAKAKLRVLPVMEENDRVRIINALSLSPGRQELIEIRAQVKDLRLLDPEAQGQIKAIDAVLLGAQMKTQPDVPDVAAAIHEIIPAQAPSPLAEAQETQSPGPQDWHRDPLTKIPPFVQAMLDNPELLELMAKTIGETVSTDSEDDAVNLREEMRITVPSTPVPTQEDIREALLDADPSVFEVLVDAARRNKRARKVSLDFWAEVADELKRHFDISPVTRHVPPSMA